MTLVVSLFETTAQSVISPTIVVPAGHLGIADYFSSTSLGTSGTIMLPGTSGSAVNLTGTYSQDTGSVRFLTMSGTAVNLNGFTTSSQTGVSSTLSMSGTAILARPLLQPPSEEHDHAVIDDNNPNSLEGANSIEWDVFPTPEIPPPLVGKERDLTRYHKAYSFTRVQPVRIRLVRR